VLSIKFVVIADGCLGFVGIIHVYKLNLRSPKRLMNSSIQNHRIKGCMYSQHQQCYTQFIQRLQTCEKVCWYQRKIFTRCTHTWYAEVFLVRRSVPCDWSDNWYTHMTLRFMFKNTYSILTTILASVNIKRAFTNIIV